MSNTDKGSKQDTNSARGNGAKGWFGWPSDDKNEQLRAQWLVAEGITSISLNPDSVIATWQKLAG